jgi:hypothetical protein
MQSQLKMRECSEMTSVQLDRYAMKYGTTHAAIIPVTKDDKKLT